MSFKKVKTIRPIMARSEGLYALSAPSDLVYVLAPRLIPVAMLLLLPMYISPYWSKVVTYACIITMLALSWDLLHNVGLLSLGQALFFGIGAYTSGCLNHYFGIHPIFTIPFAAIFGALVSTLLLLPLMRLKGLYFSMVTLAMSSILVRIIEATGILGGTTGLSALSSFPNRMVEVYGAILFALFFLFALRNMDNSNYGTILRGIGGNDRAVLSGGINIFWYKTQALYIGSFIGCFAGAYMTHVITSVGISAFAMDNSILPVASVVIGGAGSFAGAILGAFILVPLSEFLRAFGGLRIVFYCLALVLCIVLLPAGIFPYLRKRYFQYNRTAETGETRG